MSDTTIPAGLEIPKATYEALDAIGVEWDSWAHMDEVARRVAGPIVAAELRRLAAQMSKRSSGESKTGKPYRDAYAVAIAGLRVRADELDR